LEASSNHKRCRSLLRDWAAPISWSPEIVKQWFSYFGVSRGVQLRSEKQKNKETRVR